MDANISDNQDLTLLDDQGKKGLWSRVLGQIKVLHPVKIYPYIKEGQFISADNEEIVIGFPKIYNFHRSRLEDVIIKEEVERIVEKVSSLKISVAFVTISGDGVDGEITREPQVQIMPVSLNPVAEKTACLPVAPKRHGDLMALIGTVVAPNGIKPSNFQAGDDEHRSDRDSERQLREKVMQDERLRKILEVFEGKLVKVKKSQ